MQNTDKKFKKFFKNSSKNSLRVSNLSYFPYHIELLMLCTTDFAKSTLKILIKYPWICICFIMHTSLCKFWRELKVYLWVGSCFCQMVRLFYELITAWKATVFGVFLVRIFPHSDWTRTRKAPDMDIFHAVDVSSEIIKLFGRAPLCIY